MGIFGSKFEMTDAQTKKLNSLLPESYVRNLKMILITTFKE